MYLNYPSDMSAVQWLNDTGLIDTKRMAVNFRYKSAGGEEGRIVARFCKVYVEMEQDDQFWTEFQKSQV